MYDSLDYVKLMGKGWRYPALIDIYSNNWRSWKKELNGLELDPASFSSCESLLVRSLSEKPFFLQGPFSEAFFESPSTTPFFEALPRSLSFKAPSTKPFSRPLSRSVFEDSFCKDEWLWTLSTEYLTEPWTRIDATFLRPEFLTPTVFN